MFVAQLRPVNWKIWFSILVVPSANGRSITSAGEHIWPALHDNITIEVQEDIELFDNEIYYLLHDVIEKKLIWTKNWN